MSSTAVSCPHCGYAFREHKRAEQQKLQSQNQLVGCVMMIGLVVAVYMIYMIIDKVYSYQAGVPSGLFR